MKLPLCYVKYISLQFNVEDVILWHFVSLLPTIGFVFTWHFYEFMGPFFPFCFFWFSELLKLIGG